jgi:flagellar motor component MotA
MIANKKLGIMIAVAVVGAIAATLVEYWLFKNLDRQ